MHIPRELPLILAMIVVSVPGFGAASAHAGLLTIPGYTVTDLGPGTPTFSTDTNGNGVLNAPNGQLYAFPQTTNTTVVPANLPLLNPPTSDNPYEPVFNYSVGAVMNPSGMVAAVDVSGVGDLWYVDQAYY